ncbi:MAG: dihydrofolate reductase, partial [Planctomycetota bacterium]
MTQTHESTENRHATAIAAVVAVTPSGVIGRDGAMPWRLRGDLQRFKKLTMGGTLIMGRKTYDSIGRPLPG